MMVENILNYIDTLADTLKILGPMAGFFLILLESAFPILPLGIFVAFNFQSFGILVGFIISYFATCLGCIASYYLFRTFLSDFYYRRIKGRSKLRKKFKKQSKSFKDIKFSSLVILMSLPFTPASLINIISGLNKVPHRKFIAAVFISKVFIIYFWGFVGKSFLESLADIKIIIILCLILIFAYVISKIVSKRFNLE